MVQPKRCLPSFVPRAGAGEDGGDASSTDLPPVRSLDLSSNSNSALGYQEEDSAGQTNIFAVEPKAYVGSSFQSEVNPALLGAIIVGAAAVILLGLSAINNAKNGSVDVYDLPSLTELSSRLQL